MVRSAKCSLMPAARGGGDLDRGVFHGYAVVMLTGAPSPLEMVGHVFVRAMRA